MNKIKILLLSFILLATPCSATDLLILNFNGSDEATSTTDSTSRHATITFYADAQLDTAIKKFASAALLLDGTGDTLSIADSADWDFFGSSLGDYSVCTWIYPTNVAQAAWIAGQEEAATDRWFFFYVAGGELQFVTRSGGSTIISEASGSSLSDDSWQHACLMKTDDEYAIYNDGDQVGYVQDSDTDTYGAILTIGSRLTTASFHTGSMDDFVIASDLLFGASPASDESDSFTPPTTEYGAADARRRVHITMYDGKMIDEGQSYCKRYIKKKDVKGYDREIHWYIPRGKEIGGA